jgi:hypothetical protein
MCVLASFIGGVVLPAWKPNAIERMPNAAIFHFNLPCYECQLGDLKKAKESLQSAFKFDPSMRATALDDEDLKPLWKSIAGH